MSTPTPNFFNQRKERAYMISDNQSICPKCGGQLKYYDHVQRLVRTKFGNKKWVAKGTNDSDNIVQLMAGQETGDSQQLAIMEAIADLYDAVAAMIPE